MICPSPFGIWGGEDTSQCSSASKLEYTTSFFQCGVRCGLLSSATLDTNRRISVEAIRAIRTEIPPPRETMALAAALHTQSEVDRGMLFGHTLTVFGLRRKVSLIAEHYIGRFLGPRLKLH